MFKQENYLVIGLGITGQSVAEYLLRNNAKVTITDSRAEPPKLADFSSKHPHVKLFLGELIVPEDITTIVLSPGVALAEPAIQAAIQNNIPVIGDIELFAHVVDKPVLGITGSNGKSTVTTLLGEMAKACGLNPGVGGNLGTAALDLLDPKCDCYILELSSFQLETVTSLKPTVVTILNISPDHLDRYPDMLAYQRAKQGIFHNAKHAVINRADALTDLPQGLDIMTTSFGLDPANGSNFGVIDIDGVQWLAKGTTKLLRVKEMAMLGAHNVANALAALAMGEIAGFNMEAMLTTLRQFKGLEHRCEVVTTFQNVVWVNDSKGTNVAATVAAIEGLAKSIPGKWIIILGGIGKNADFAPLLAPVQEHCKAAILIGGEQKQLWDLLHDALPCYKATDLPHVIKIAGELATIGDGVLLSPACASFDMFENYAHRGSLFKQQVLQWIVKHATTIAN